jgi:ADP-ribose pyrophosphatase YjhB (NUDIX family)
MATPVSETFCYCPSCGSKQDTVGVSPFRCDDCNFGFYFSPATAVGAIIVNGDGNILLLIRARDPGKGKYGLPGGFVDAGETLETSLIREVLEETSLTVTKVEYLCSFPNSYTYRDVTIDVLDAFYVCEIDSFDDLQAQPDEVDSFYIGSLNADVLSKMAFESNRRAIEVFLAKSK